MYTQVLIGRAMCGFGEWNEVGRERNGAGWLEL